MVAGYGRRVLVEDEDGKRHRCMVAGRRLRTVCGDRVEWAPPHDDGDGLVTAVRDRHNELARPDSRGRREVLAANLDQVVVVAAPTPRPDPFIVDRYLAAAELMGARPCLVVNKSELEAPSAPLDPEEYRRVGIPTLAVSALEGQGLEDLRRLLQGHTSILVGQSGVGKSSILNALIPHTGALTGELGRGGTEGRHTTTASLLYHLESGGHLIDAPGVRDYAPPPVDPRDVATGFREIAALAPRCKFANCMHMAEPRCAVRSAVEDGKLSARRYESYRRLVRLMERLESPG